MRILGSLFGVHKERLALTLLEEHGVSYGLELVQFSGGKLSRGTIYIWLDRLEDKGLVRSRRASASGRRVYTITALGRRALEEE